MPASTHQQQLGEAGLDPLLIFMAEEADPDAVAELGLAASDVKSLKQVIYETSEVII